MTRNSTYESERVENPVDAGYSSRELQDLSTSFSFCVKMTLHSLMNFGGFGSYGKTPPVSIERYHSGSGGYHHHHHGGSKGKGGGNSAALSALTLLAFLFLMNVMQQSLQNDTNSTMASSGTTALLLRDSAEQPISLLSAEEKDSQKESDFVKLENSYARSPEPPSQPNANKREKNNKRS